MVEKTRTRSLSKPRISLKPRPSKTNKNEPDMMKLLHVSVTIVSLSGVYFKESTKGKNAGDDSTSGPKVHPKTTVVASFSRDGDALDAAVDEHVRSLPLDLSKSIPKAKDAPKEAVVWPTKEMDGNTASTFQFERYFLREKQKKRSKKKEQHVYAAQSCRVQLAVCRNRRWFKLGDADIVINGDERDASFSVPLINHDTPKTKKSKGNVIPMARLKGETLKCGLGSNAALQVVVNISESPNVEKILHPNLATVVSWEYDPQKAAVVKKNQKGVSDDKAAQKAYLLSETSAGDNNSKAPEKKQDHSNEKKSENLDTIAGAKIASMFNASGKEPSEVTKVASLPVRSNSTPSKADSKAYSVSALRRESNSSRPVNILDKITTVVNEPSSPQSSTSTSAQQSEAQASTVTPPQIPVRPIATRAFSPIRVSSPMKNLSPLRALSPLRQNSDTSSVNKPSVLDRVVTITADPVPSPRARSLSEHLASTPPRTVNGNDQSIYFIEHDMQPSDESNLLDPPSADEMKKTRTRSSMTMSTEKSSQMSESSEYSQSGFISRDASTFDHSNNSAFTTVSGYSVSKTSNRPSSNPHTEGEDMNIVMAELLEKSPSELYAIIHDIDPKEAKMIKREKERSSQRPSRSKSRKAVEEESVESDHSDGSDTYDYESIGESSFFYESEGESECSESYVSFVEERRKSKNKKSNSLVEKIFGRRFMCNFPMCGIGQKGDDKTLSYVDDEETYVNGKEYIRGNNSTWTGSSSSSSGNIY